MLSTALYSEALTLVYCGTAAAQQQPAVTAHRLREVDDRRAQTAVCRLALAQNLTPQRTLCAPIDSLTAAPPRCGPAVAHSPPSRVNGPTATRRQWRTVANVITTAELRTETHSRAVGCTVSEWC